MKTLVIDCHYLCYRALYSTGNLKHESKDTGIIFGFLSMLLELAKEFHTNRMIFCWDHPHSFRSEMYPAYKSSRTKRTPAEQVIVDDAKKQFNELRETVLKRIGFQNIHQERGFEADDLIASVAVHRKFPGTVYMVTSDEDMYQCIRKDAVVWYNPNKNLLMDEKKLMDMYQVSPGQWRMVKMIAGCGSDDIAGVKGVGEATAIKYILGELTKGKKYDDIVANKKLIRSNSPLVSLPFDGTPKIEYYRQDMFDLPEMLMVFEENGFNSFIERMPEWQEFIEGQFQSSAKQLIKEKLNRKKG